MGSIRLHIPKFNSASCDPSLRRTEHFNSLDELKEIDFVKAWTIKDDFDHFEVSSPDYYPLLMAILQDGSSWVVGQLSDLHSELSDIPCGNS